MTLKSNIIQSLKYFIVVFFFSFFYNSNAQNPVHISVSNSTFASTDSVLPFWLAANQYGKIKVSNSFLNITEFSAEQSYNSEKKIGFTWGGHLVGALGNSSYFQLNQAFAGISFKGWELKGGRFYEETKYAGLSTTNGNLSQSQNTIPVPKIRFSTIGFIPLPFVKKWFAFRFEYEEGFLNDNRYVNGTHLHHKSLYGKIHPESSWHIQFGFEHYVMWGGISQNEKIGQLPEGWNAYWHYVLALPGGKDFPQTEQQNVSGNQLGTYQFEFLKDFQKFTTSFYLSHPWEDNSGINWHNWPDNLLGTHIYIKGNPKLITDIVYEFTNTRQQSIKDSIYVWDENAGIWKMNEYDNYYNHSIYRSGYTYQQLVMSSPLFYPVIKNNDISMGIQSNRFLSHHLGVKGDLTEFLKWKGMLTYIQHLGTYSNPYESVQKQLTGLFEVEYVNPDFPVQLGLSAGCDASNISGKNLGFRFSVAKYW